MNRNGHNGKPTQFEAKLDLRRYNEILDRAVRLADTRKGYSVDAPRNVGSVEPGAPRGSRIPTIPTASFDPVRAEGNWAPFRPAPKPIPGIIDGYRPGDPLIGEAQWGGTGTPITAGFLTDLGEYNQDLFGRSAVATYEKMRRGDAQVWGTLMAVKGPLQSATWDVEPGVASNDPGYQKAKEVAEFVKENLFGGMEFQTSTGGWTSQAWDQVMWNALLCLDFGVSVHEDVYTVDGNNLKLRNLVPLLPITFYRWHTESDGYTLIALEQYGYRGIEFINASVPAEKVCRFTLNQEGSNFWGMSLLRSAYPHWYIKNQLYRIDAIAAERNGLGVPVVILAEQPSVQDRQTAFNFVTKLGAHELTGLVLPYGAQFEIKGPQGQPRDLQRSIEHHNRMISTTALAMFMTIGSAPHGSRATAATQHDFFLAASQHLATYIGDRVTGSTIRRLAVYNFGPDVMVPHLIAKNVKMRDFEDVREALENLAAKGLLVSDKPIRDLIRDEYELPPETDKGVVTTAGEIVTDENGDPVGGQEPPAEGKLGQPGTQGGPPANGKQTQDADGKAKPALAPAKKEDTQRAKQQKGVTGTKKPGAKVNDQLQASDTPFARTDTLDREELSEQEVAEPVIYFGRHGETDDDVDQEHPVVTSWNDLPLNENGEKEAERAAGKLEDKDIAEIYTSDLKRCKQMADAIAEATGAEVIEDRGLRGWRIPEDWRTDVHTELPNGKTIGQQLSWLQAHPHIKPKGGDSWFETEARIGDALERAMLRAKMLGKPIAVITHSRVLGALPSFSRGMIHTKPEAPDSRAKVGSVTKATMDPESGEWNLDFSAKQLSDYGYHSIADDVFVTNPSNRSGQPTQRAVSQKKNPVPASDEEIEAHAGTSSAAIGGQSPNRRKKKAKKVEPVDVMAKQASHGARIVHEPDLNASEFKPSARQERNIGIGVPEKDDKQDTPLNPTPETAPVVRETFREKTRSRDGKVFFEAHHGKEKTSELRQHYAGIYSAIVNKITGPIKYKVIASVAAQAARQLKAKVPVPKLHFAQDHQVRSMLDDLVEKMFDKASDQARNEVRAKRKR